MANPDSVGMTLDLIWLQNKPKSDMHCFCRRMNDVDQLKLEVKTKVKKEYELLYFVLLLCTLWLVRSGHNYQM